MSFTHLEQALVLLKRYDKWSAEVASIIRQRFQIPEGLIEQAAAGDEEQLRTLVPEVELKNYVFLANYDMSLNAHYFKDAFLTPVNVKGETAFVNFFRLTQLEYLMLRELKVIRDVQDRTEQKTLKNEFEGENLQLTEKAQRFHRHHANLFADFSNTTVVDMQQLAKQAKLQNLERHGQVDCSAFYIFYIQYYLPGLDLCGRNESQQLNRAMKGLSHNLEIKDLINADLIQQEILHMLDTPRWQYLVDYNYRHQRRSEYEHKLFLSKHESNERRHQQGFPPRREHELYPYNPLSKTHPTTRAQIYYC
jgi:hypothetical protein